MLKSLCCEHDLNALRTLVAIKSRVICCGGVEMNREEIVIQEGTAVGKGQFMYAECRVNGVYWKCEEHVTDLNRDEVKERLIQTFLFSSSNFQIIL